MFTRSVFKFFCFFWLYIFCPLYCFFFTFAFLASFYTTLSFIFFSTFIIFPTSHYFSQFFPPALSFVFVFLSSIFFFQASFISIPNGKKLANVSLYIFRNVFLISTWDSKRSHYFPLIKGSFLSSFHNIFLISTLGSKRYHYFSLIHGYFLFLSLLYISSPIHTCTSIPLFRPHSLSLPSPPHS